MSSVTQRIKEIKQPYGGYLKPSEFEEIQYSDNNELMEENISGGLVGLVVDYMTRYVMGSPKEEAFKISLLGAKLIREESKALKLLNNIDGLNIKSVYNACKLVGYDVCYRAGLMGYKPVEDIEADDNTINNIIIMINRSVTFFDNYGPIILDGFTFEGGYTGTINAGDGDFITENTLWDFKVSSRKPTTAHTLQLLIYYIMGKHSIHKEFNNIEKLGIFNPRLNCVYLKEIKNIPLETIEVISNEVIGYDTDSKTVKFETKDDDISGCFSLEEITNILECSRYRVMKYYSEEGLPLKKIKNKYYIDKVDLYDWIQQKVEEAKERKKIALLVGLITFVIIMIIIKLLMN